MKPEELLYAKTHEWVRVETDPSGAKTATMGLSAFAIETLTDLVFIDLPEPGRQIVAGDSFGEVASVKAVSDLYSPIDGEIVEVNTEAAGQPDTLGDDPYGSGWLVKIKIADDSGLATLMDYAAYQKQLKENAE